MQQHWKAKVKKTLLIRTRKTSTQNNYNQVQISWLVPTNTFRKVRVAIKDNLFEALKCSRLARKRSFR